MSRKWTGGQRRTGSAQEVGRKWTENQQEVDRRQTESARKRTESRQDGIREGQELDRKWTEGGQEVNRKWMQSPGAQVCVPHSGCATEVWWKNPQEVEPAASCGHTNLLLHELKLLQSESLRQWAL